MDTASQAPASQPDLPEAPYIGIRPFERTEQEIFFGRKRDAQFLTDKIFSARLTLLYAQSGLGKSSLLRALVIPQLEDEQALTLYFDDWTGEAPLDLLKTKLIELAQTLDIPNAGAGAPSLTELMRLITSRDNRTPILLFDQFEEFLDSHGRDLDPLREELAELVRASDVDVHVLISLRQEFLAALEPFRQTILNLFESTYCLTGLDDKGVHEAIEGPLQRFEATIEDSLTTQLIQDLKDLDATLSESFVSKSPRTTDAKIVEVDLPLLQLICSQLWKARKESRLSLELYKGLGGAHKILKTYVHNVMPRRREDEYFTARNIMRYLAPPSGLKQSYAVVDLLAVAELDKGSDFQRQIQEQRLAKELERLSNADILCARPYRGKTRYELRHDAFIKLIAPWRDEILDEAERQRKKFVQRRKEVKALSLFALVGMVVIIIVTPYIKEKRLYYERTEGRLQDLSIHDERARAGRELEGVSWFLLQSPRKEPEHLDLLKTLLIKYKDALPQYYGVDNSGINYITLPGSDWPFRLTYSSARPLNQWYFNLTWQSMAKAFNEYWGIPVPKRIYLQPDSTYPKGLLRLTATPNDEIATYNPLEGKQSQNQLELRLPSYETLAFISEAKLPWQTREFFERFISEWKEIPEAKHGGPWWIVPRWSLPVWNSAGLQGNDGSGLPAFILALKLQQQPELLLTQDAVDLLLERISSVYPQTVKEANAARGDRMRQDLVEVVRIGRGLTHLSNLLDMLAAYPAETSEDAALSIDLDVDGASAQFPFTLSGPWKLQAKKKQETKANDAQSNPVDESIDAGVTRTSVQTAYDEIKEWLPAVEPPIRVYVGASLENTWFPDGELGTEMRQKLDRFRDEFSSRFGYDVPGVRFIPNIHDPSGLLTEDAFRIEILNQTDQSPYAQPIVTESNNIDRFVEALKFRVEYYRIHWLNAERIYWLLEELSPELHSWLEIRYSLTDIKILLRNVVDPTLEELDVRASAGGKDIVQIPPENTLRDLEWMLASLVFWSTIHDHLDPYQMAEDLRHTQRAKTSPVSLSSLPAAINDPLKSGAKYIGQGKLAAAENAFKSAARLDPEKAADGFLSAYAQQLHASQALALNKACNDPIHSKLTRAQRLDIEDLLGSSIQELTPEKRHRFTLCLLASYPKERIAKRQTLVSSLFEKHGDPQSWSVNEAHWLAEEILHDSQLRDYDPTWRQMAANYLKNAVSRLNEDESGKAFWSLWEICEEPGPNSWCLELLGKLAESRPDTQLALWYAYVLGFSERRQALEDALTWADRASKNISKKKYPTDEERARWLNTVLFTRAQALQGLCNLGDATSCKGAEEDFYRLLEFKGFAQDAASWLIQLWLANGELDRAENQVDDALTKWPEDSRFYVEKLLLQLLKMDDQGAAETATKVVDAAGKNAETLFVAALGQILTERGQWERTGRAFLETDHPYVPYVLMMLYAFMADETKDDAIELLNQRWSKIKPYQENWPVRMRGGDIYVWREMLIGYYVGDVKRSEIFDKIENEQVYERSDFRFLPMPRRGLLCEAYFYDAILAKADNHMDVMQDRLQKVLDTDHRTYHEYKMAKFLFERYSKNLK